MHLLADFEEQRFSVRIKALFHLKLINIVTERSVLKLFVYLIDLFLCAADSLIYLRNEITNKSTLKLFALSFEFLLGFLNLHVGKISVLVPVIIYIGHASHLKIRAVYPAIRQMSIFEFLSRIINSTFPFSYSLFGDRGFLFLSLPVIHIYRRLS